MITIYKTSRITIDDKGFSACNCPSMSLNNNPLEAENNNININACTSIAQNDATYNVNERGVITLPSATTRIIVNDIEHDVDEGGVVDLGHIGEGEGGGIQGVNVNDKACLIVDGVAQVNNVTQYIKLNDVMHNTDEDGIVDLGTTMSRLNVDGQTFTVQPDGSITVYSASSTTQSSHGLMRLGRESWSGTAKNINPTSAQGNIYVGNTIELFVRYGKRPALMTANTPNERYSIWPFQASVTITAVDLDDPDYVNGFGYRDGFLGEYATLNFNIGANWDNLNNCVKGYTLDKFDPNVLVQAVAVSTTAKTAKWESGDYLAESPRICIKLADNVVARVQVAYNVVNTLPQTREDAHYQPSVLASARSSAGDIFTIDWDAENNRYRITDTDFDGWLYIKPNGDIVSSNNAYVFECWWETFDGEEYGYYFYAFISDGLLIGFDGGSWTQQRLADIEFGDQGASTATIQTRTTAVVHNWNDATNPIIVKCTGTGRWAWGDKA